MTAPQTDAFFLEAEPGCRFCLLHRASGPVRGAVLFVHAFAEEMNKSRRMVARQARALAQSGFEVLQVDLLGCGDSSGDFSDATWSAWLEDVDSAWRFVAGRSAGPVWLWGQRTGCLLACEFARALQQPARLVLWHPVASGRQFVNQFLRMKTLGLSATADSPRVDTRALRAAFAGGAPVEVAGYTLAPALFARLDEALLQAPPPGSRVCWFDIAHAADAPRAASSTRLVQEWAQLGVAVSHHVVVGPPFWQTQEISECEPLLEQTLRNVCT